MHGMKYLTEDAARPCGGAWLRIVRMALCAAAASAAALTAVAQAPAATGAAEPAAAADPNAAVEPEAEPPGVWNRRRAAPTGVDAQLRRLAANLRLDAGQQEKIRPILLAHRDQVERLLHDTQLAPAERQKRVLALGDRSADQIRAQLTDDQRAQYIQPRAAPVVAQAASAAKRGTAAAAAPGTKPVK